MTLRAKYNEGARKNKHNINPTNLDYDFVQDSKFQLSFNDYGVFHNQNKLSKYQKILEYTISPHYPHQKQNNQNKYVQNQQTKNKDKQQKVKVLSEITNLQISNQFDQSYEKKYLVGSIKRNKKQSIVYQNKILHQQYFENGIDLEQIQLLRLSKIEEMQAKLNKVINKEHLLPFVEEIKRQNKDNKAILQDRRGQFHLQHVGYNKRSQSISKVTSQDKENSISNSKTNKAQKLTEIDYLQFLFKILDDKNKGMLSKQNCRIQLLSQEFKFIFGSIFTRIFLKKLACNKREFVKLCMNSLKQLNSAEVIDLLKLFTQRFQSRQKIFENQHRLFRQSNKNETSLKMHLNSREESKQISFQYGNHQNQYLIKEWNQNSRSQPLQKYNQLSTWNSSLKHTSISQKYTICCQESTITSKKQEKQSFVSSIKRKSISESRIEQHKQSLHEMLELQRKMSEVLQYEALKQSQNSQKNCSSGTESLNFSQLVKHI